MPEAVQLLPFSTQLNPFARRLGDEGADGLILFNRLYQPDVNITAQQEEPSLQLSTSADLLVPLRWVGILSGRVKPDLVVTGGVQRAEDAVKAIMCGASIVQVVSLLLKRGPEFLSVLVENLRRWMDANGHSNLDDIRGSMSLRSFPSPESFERGLYMHLLQTWTRPTGRL